MQGKASCQIAEDFEIADEALFVVSKDQAGTRLDPFASWSPLARRNHIDRALADQGDERLPISERLFAGTSMAKRIAAFVEDFAHRQVIGALIERLATPSLRRFLDDLRQALRLRGP